MDHPATFPATTIYRTKFDAQTASTLSENGYFITVAGQEDYGFQKNYHFYDYYNDGTGGGWFEYAKTDDNTGEFYFELRLADYPGVIYTVDGGGVGLSSCVGSMNQYILPDCFTRFSYEADTESFRNNTLYVRAGSDTARLLDDNSISWIPLILKLSALPAGITEIEEEAFISSAFEEVVIPSGCVTIGPRAFANSDRLVVVHIPKSVKQIDATAFENCTGVTFYVKSGSTAESFVKSYGSGKRWHIQYE